jgi:cytochrome c5
MNKIVILAALAFLVSCGTSKQTVGKVGESSTPVIEGMSQADVDRGSKEFPGLTLDELVEGKKLYENNCNLCHALKKPTAEPASEWRKVVPPMVEMVNTKKNGNLDAIAQEKILRYVVTMSSK